MDYQIDGTIENLSLQEAEYLQNLIIDFANAHNTFFGGGIYEILPETKKESTWQKLPKIIAKFLNSIIL